MTRSDGRGRQKWEGKVGTGALHHCQKAGTARDAREGKPQAPRARRRADREADPAPPPSLARPGPRCPRLFALALRRPQICYLLAVLWPSCVRLARRDGALLPIRHASLCPYAHACCICFVPLPLACSPPVCRQDCGPSSCQDRRGFAPSPQRQ